MANSIGQDLLAVPFPEMVEKLAMSIATAQLELDLKSVQVAQMMAGQKVVVPNPDFPDDRAKDRTIEPQRVVFGKRYKNESLTGTSLTADGNKEDADFSLLELGFMPNFYQFVDTIIEVKISISMTKESSYSQSSSTTRASAGWGSVKVSTVSASYSSKYSYHAEGASLLRTKLVPVPPPAVLEERIRMLMDNGGVYPVKTLIAKGKTTETAAAGAG